MAPPTRSEAKSTSKVIVSPICTKASFYDTDHHQQQPQQRQGQQAEPSEDLYRSVDVRNNCQSPKSSQILATTVHGAPANDDDNDDDASHRLRRLPSNGARVLSLLSCRSCILIYRLTISWLLVQGKAPCNVDRPGTLLVAGARQ